MQIRSSGWLRVAPQGFASVTRPARAGGIFRRPFGFLADEQAGGCCFAPRARRLEARPARGFTFDQLHSLPARFLLNLSSARLGLAWRSSGRLGEKLARRAS
ncbi:Hypothetical predicted protein [Olea europaea subsp. europaea]|uniref:Uncharacterized protein n=1 Tax=Olea europaea subsp. europaea TaxID=158383 RepID=A0A8S0VPI3_OLEEU|nr:Hypothetical predicted protein [Olea europaea subsp. europaea]